MSDLLRAWNIADEREVAPGYYAKLTHIITNWTIWRFESANGVSVSAGKSAVSHRHVIPLGVSQSLWGGVPWIRLHFYKDKPTQASLHGSHMHDVRAEARIVGDRFPKSLPMFFDPQPYDGKKLEVFIQSMPGPRSFSKLTKDHGIIDMTGLSEVIAAAAQVE